MRELTEQDLQRVYDETFAREVARGTTFVVAEGRALVARLKASAGVAGSAPGDSGISPEDALGPRGGGVGGVGKGGAKAPPPAPPPRQAACPRAECSPSRAPRRARAVRR